ncbi:MAG: hypothetical protein AMK72_11925 [Planctomycetes bacterium SM23_25]|nr:MAG: hypothetical protein AMK72_11925 [Planctomycetes bacterium SM23_25]
MRKEVTCICSGCTEGTRDSLEQAGIRVIEVRREEAPTSILAKLRHYVGFRIGAWRILDSEDEDVLLWVAKTDTAMALGRRLRKRRYVLVLYELHDRFPLYQRAIRFYAPRARRVIVPEACRAAILRYWHGLARTPFVLPNRPLDHPRQRNLVISDEGARKILASVSPGQKIVLYQGSLAADRDLIPIACALQRAGAPYRFVVMGRDREGRIGQLRRFCPNLVHIPWVVPPAHLEVTSHASVGIAAYAYDALNSIFCAPNKIWEYTGFGIPMLCQDVPGLRFTVGASGAGVCVSLAVANEIVEGLLRIDRDYEDYSRRASEFYESVDTLSLLREAIRGV